MNKETTVIELQPASDQLKNLDRPNVIVFPPILLLGAGVLGTVLQLIWPIHLRATLLARMAGGIPFLMGLALIISAKKSMRRVGTNVRPDKPTTAIASDGPYRLTRNPIYLGGSLVYIGITLMLNVFWPLPALVPSLILLNWGVIQREEIYLEEKFGDAYLAYKNHVRRWL